MKTSLSRWGAALAVLLLLQVVSPLAQAQFRAGIQGVVRDPSGAVVPGAKVTLTSQETKAKRTVTTSSEGVYAITSLAPGSYELAVEKEGFARKVLADVRITAEQMQSVDVTLSLGQTTESVTVSESVVPLIDTQTAVISGTITSKEVENLPAFGRDPYQLLRLAPGVFGDGALTAGGGSSMLPGTNMGAAGATDSVFKVENGAQIIANGTRQNSNNFQIDGVGVNSASWGGAAVITPNEESVKEVRVVANNYSAELGRNSGAQVLVVSKNGTNDPHGSFVAKFHRPDLNAYQRWNGPGTPSPVGKDTNDFNQFAGSLGGPILKNRLFAFFSYETIRNDSVNISTGWYETPQFRQNAAPSNSIARQLMSYPGVEPVAISTINLTCAQAGLPSTQCRDVAGGVDLGSPLRLPLKSQDPTFGQPNTPYGIGGGFDGVPDAMFLQTQGPNKVT
ncbi:MAG: carboxypeptidase regulatory-like domain-containing protein, partial [Bryobacteraceae bacterium]